VTAFPLNFPKAPQQGSAACRATGSVIEIETIIENEQTSKALERRNRKGSMPGALSWEFRAGRPNHLMAQNSGLVMFVAAAGIPAGSGQRARGRVLRIAERLQSGLRGRRISRNINRGRQDIAAMLAGTS
jgi:hypothetical protein